MFVAFFIYAMFNDDAAAILQKYIFRRGQPQKMPEEYYDERLYGRPSGSQRRNQNQRNLPQGQRRQLPPSNQPQLRAPQNQYQSYSSNGVPVNQRRQNNGYNNYGGTQQRSQNRGQNRNQEQYRQNPYGQNSSQYGSQNYNQSRGGQYNGQNYDDGSETHTYTIPGRNNQQ